MWKLLRNLILAAIFVAGAMKLLAGYAVRQDSQRVVAELAKYVQLKYTGISAGLDGSVSLDDVSITPAATHKLYHAAHVMFTTPGLHWLLRRALLHENSLPQQFGINVEGLALPPDASWLNRQVYDPQTFVPFASIGCGARDLNVNDYRKMGLDPGSRSQQLDYRYNDETRTLNATLTLSAPGFSKTVIAAELSGFDPARLPGAGAIAKLQLNQVTVDYTDLGFEQARNRYCAQRAAISKTQFVDRHIDGVRALLLKLGITPNDSLTQLYRTLVSNGGHVSVLSLPSKDFVPRNWQILGGNEIWRQLNVTARYANTPPVMFGLEFSPVSTPNVATAAAPVASALDARPAQTQTTPTQALVFATQAKSTPIVATAPIAKPMPVAAAIVVAPKATDKPAQTQNIAAAALRDPIVPPTKPARDSLGFGGLDHEEAKLAPLIVKPANAASAALPSPVMPSSPPPPPNSTLALVWKPVIDELPETKPPPPDYTVIDIERLAHEQGRRVRLITNGNTKVEGYVVDVDATGVRLRVDRGGGEAQFSIPRSRIEQVQLIKR